MNPIIIPIASERKVNCIVQDNIRYCENENVEGKTLGLIFLSIVALMLWIMFSIWIGGKISYGRNIDEIPVIISISFIIPLLVVGIYLIL